MFFILLFLNDPLIQAFTFFPSQVSHRNASSDRKLLSVLSVSWGGKHRDSQLLLLLKDKYYVIILRIKQHRHAIIILNREKNTRRHLRVELCSYKALSSSLVQQHEENMTTAKA